MHATIRLFPQRYWVKMSDKKVRYYKRKVIYRKEARKVVHF